MGIVLHGPWDACVCHTLPWPALPRPDQMHQFLHYLPELHGLHGHMGTTRGALRAGAAWVCCTGCVLCSCELVLHANTLYTPLQPIAEWSPAMMYRFHHPNCSSGSFQVPKPSLARGGSAQMAGAGVGMQGYVRQACTAM